MRRQGATARDSTNNNIQACRIQQLHRHFHCICSLDSSLRLLRRLLRDKSPPGRSTAACGQLTNTADARGARLDVSGPLRAYYSSSACRSCVCVAAPAQSDSAACGDRRPDSTWRLTHIGWVDHGSVRELEMPPVRCVAIGHRERQPRALGEQ